MSHSSSNSFLHPYPNPSPHPFPTLPLNLLSIPFLTLLFKHFPLFFSLYSILFYSFPIVFFTLVITLHYHYPSLTLVITLHYHYPSLHPSKPFHCMPFPHTHPPSANPSSAFFSNTFPRCFSSTLFHSLYPSFLSSSTNLPLTFYCPSPFTFTVPPQPSSQLSLTFAHHSIFHSELFFYLPLSSPFLCSSMHTLSFIYLYPLYNFFSFSTSVDDD